MSNCIILTAKVKTGGQKIQLHNKLPHFKDVNNMDGGCTVIVTLTKEGTRDHEKEFQEEQLHGMVFLMPKF